MTAPDADPPFTTERIRSRLNTLSADPLDPGRAEAAVLIALRFGDEGAAVLAEQRAERGGDPWSGHVGLPGGRKDPRDRSLAETALRELQEELGLPPSTIVGPPRVFDIRRARPSGLRVAVFAGLFAGPPEAPRGTDSDEVASAFWLPLHTLQHIEPQPRPTMFGEVSVDTAVFDGHVVWGFTLRVLRDFVGWAQTSEAPPSDGQVRPWRSQAL